LARPATHDTEAEYRRLLKRAEHDPLILAFWLGGSRNQGFETPYSDYDVGMIVAEDAYAPILAELGMADTFQADWRPGIDLSIRTFPMFEAFAAWDSGERGYRYMFAHLKALVDKTGRAQPLIDAKACVPAEEIAPFLQASLDHFLNQVYRGLKLLRDGNPGASQLEAAEGVGPFLDAAFALHGGRLRPYYKYLAWELCEHPLAALPFTADDFMARLAASLAPGGVLALRGLMTGSLDAFRAAGHGAAIDGWGETIDWMARWRPPAA
jgi:hypothetical protein